jgi:hypothetical protein
MRIPNFRRSLLAVLLGNLVYFALMPHLPWELRHRPDRIDVGLLVDFVVCAILYWGFGVILRHQRNNSDARQH